MFDFVAGRSAELVLCLNCECPEGKIRESGGDRKDREAIGHVPLLLNLLLIFSQRGSRILPPSWIMLTMVLMRVAVLVAVLSALSRVIIL